MITLQAQFDGLQAKFDYLEAAYADLQETILGMITITGET